MLYLFCWGNETANQKGIKMNYVKITHGYVQQTFNDQGDCIEQMFVAGDDCEYETDEGDPINPTDMPFGGIEYFPFEMKQPSRRN